LLANVEALEGDAYELLRDRGPFGLVFADGGPSVEVLTTPRSAAIVAVKR
jgi:hypothetical protein